MKKLFILCFFCIACSPQVSDELLIYWSKHQTAFKDLARVSRPAYVDADVVAIYQDGVRTREGQFAKTGSLGSVFPKHQALLYELVTKMKDLNCGMLLGNGYVAFFIQSGGVLGSDVFIVNQLNRNGIDSFFKDVALMELHKVMKKEVEDNWFLISAD